MNPVRAPAPEARVRKRLASAEQKLVEPQEAAAPSSKMAEYFRERNAGFENIEI